MLNNSNSSANSDFYKGSKISFSLEKLLEDFSFWFPKARNYGYTASELYKTDECAILTLIPIPIVKEGNYKLWLFCFSRVERITPRIKDLWLKEVSELFSDDLYRISHLIHFEYHFIVADVIRSRITPKLGRKSVYVIKADYAYKVYEIIAKAIKGFVESFRKNVKYGEDLLYLCDELERFAERIRKRARELKSKSTTQLPPTRHPFDIVNDPKDSREFANLDRGEVMK